MDGPKFVPIKKLDEKVGSDPLHQVSSEHQLDGARNLGNKFELLEALLIEGKLARQPYAGPQALKSETNLSSGEVITEAIVGGRTAGIQIAQALTPEQRHGLMTRVLEERPSLSVRELKATCAMLAIDAKPFVEQLIGAKTEKLHDAIQQTDRTRDISKIILTFTYQPREDIEMLTEHYKEVHGQTVSANLQHLLKNAHDKLNFDLALFGRAQSPLEDLERIQAVLAFEKSERLKNGYFFVKADHVHLNSAEEKLKKAAELLDKDELISDDSYDAFKSFLDDAKDDINRYQKNVSSYDRDPAAWIALFIALGCLIGIAWITYSSRSPVAIVAAFSIGLVLLYRRSLTKRSNPEYYIRTLKKKYMTESQIRAFEKSAALKSRIF